MKSSKVLCKMLFLLFFLMSSKVMDGEAGLADSWITFVEESKGVLSTCLNNSTETLLSWSCLTTGSLELFDKITSSDVIPLTNTVRLIRYRSSFSSDTSNDSSTNDASNTSNTSDASNNKQRMAANSFSIDNNTWSGRVLQRFSNVFATHTVQLDIDSKATGTGRARHRNQMLPMMVFGVTALGMVMVPIGFQFLAVVAGKALLLSKMALLLASVNGIKRVATSGVHYGLYHSEPHPHFPHQWDRTDRDFHPRNLNVNS